MIMFQVDYTGGGNYCYTFQINQKGAKIMIKCFERIYPYMEIMIMFQLWGYGGYGKYDYVSS